MSTTLSFDTTFDLQSGLAAQRPSTQRRLSAMKNMFADEPARAAMEGRNDPLVYEFYELGLPEEPGEIAFGTSIVYPGRVAGEYFMTKGHFHTILDTAEVYLCLRGRGLMLMESPEGACEAAELTPGRAVHVPPRYAHRSVNVSSDEPLVTFFAFRADAGHNYGAIETRGFRKLAVARDGQPVLVDNPRWAGEGSAA